eukprot:NODE_528_length_7173_cov_0.249929.p4 type:complete len:395 gc:universal NODE_528_length_7173_cov_0.249929:6690-5506(-)
MFKKSSMKPKSNPVEDVSKVRKDPKRIALLDSLTFMIESWDSLYTRSSMMNKKSLDVQMLAFSISAVLQKTQAYIKAHQKSIPKAVVPKLKAILQEIKTMIAALLEATQSKFESHEKLLGFIYGNYLIVQQFSVKLHKYLLNEDLELESPSKLQPESPAASKMRGPPSISTTMDRSAFSFIKSPQGPQFPEDLMRASVASSNSSNGIYTPLKHRRVISLTKPKVLLMDDHLLDKFVCNEVLKCYHFITQKYPATKKHLPLLYLSGTADEQDEQILSHFLTDLCDGVIFCRLFNIFAESKRLQFIDNIKKPKEYFDRMDLIRLCQKHSMQNNWDLYTVKTNAIDALAISKKTVKGNKHVCAMFIKFVYVSVGRDLNTDGWESNISRWLDYSKVGY